MQAANPSEPTLAERITAAVQSGDLYLPPLPELATKIGEMLADENCDWKQVAELIRNEPSIVASVLKMANSAAFGGLRQITDLTQAIGRLGLRRVASVVTALLHKGHFESDRAGRTVLLRHLWDHAVCTALAARRLASSGGDTEEAFLAGLLHDTGKLLVLKGVDAVEKESKEPLTEALLSELIEALHADLGFRTLQSWNVAEPVCRVARDHHGGAEAGDLLLLRVQAANLIAKKLGAHPQPDPEIHLLEQQPVEQLGLNDVELATLMVDLEDEFTEVRRLF